MSQPIGLKSVTEPSEPVSTTIPFNEKRQIRFSTFKKNFIAILNQFFRKVESDTWLFFS